MESKIVMPVWDHKKDKPSQDQEVKASTKPVCMICNHDKHLKYVTILKDKDIKGWICTEHNVVIPDIEDV